MARGLAEAARAAGIAVQRLEIPFDPRKSYRPLPTPRELGMPVGLVVADADVVVRWTAWGVLPGPGSIGRSRMIGCWSWDAPGRLPASWHHALPLFDEIWTPGTYAAGIIAPQVAVPVVAVAPSIGRGAASQGLDRQAMGLHPTAFTYLCAFDGRGNLDCQNPVDVVRAYRLAFPAAAMEQQLVLKTHGLSDHQRAGFGQLTEGRPDIHLVEATLDAGQTNALIAGCDCLVSLHRAVGLGFAMAEAMAAGRPVIATAYSGNMEFMTPENAYLVDFRLRAAIRPSPPFAAGTDWAFPRIAHAAQLMLRARHRPDETAAKGARAAEFMAREYSPMAAGARLKARLEMRLPTDRSRPGPSRPSRAMEAGTVPSILLATPAKDARRFLERYFDLLWRLDYDPKRLSLALLESDSADDTWQALEERRAALAAHFGRMTLLQRDFGFRPPGMRHAPAIQRERRSILARSRNRLLAKSLADEDWVLWLDVDVIDYPPDLIQRLLATGKDIVVPHCIAPGGRTYDLNSFVLEPEGQPEDQHHLVSGIFQPPRGVGRKYLDSFRGQTLVELDCVGGTALLVRADLHREGLNFPTVSHRGYIETEGLGMLAADMGHRCWGMPDLEIVHAPY